MGRPLTAWPRKLSGLEKRVGLRRPRFAARRLRPVVLSRGTSGLSPWVFNPGTQARLVPKEHQDSARGLSRRAHQIHARDVVPKGLQDSSPGF
jgi:hypothetical protein